MMILFTQSTAVLHKYLNNELKIPCLLQFFPEVAQNSQNSLNFPCSEKSLSIPGFPGLWPPWISFQYEDTCINEIEHDTQLDKTNTLNLHNFIAARGLHNSPSKYKNIFIKQSNLAKSHTSLSIENVSAP